MAHLNPEELLAKFRAARAASEGSRRDPHPLKLHRELVEACPAFTPSLLELARLLRLTDEPGVDAEEMLAEVQRLLEQAVQSSNRSADAPDSERIMGAVYDARQAAVAAGLLPPEVMEP